MVTALIICWRLQGFAGVVSSCIVRYRGAMRQSPPPAMTTADLAGVALGVQPAEARWVSCLVCGRWYRNLACHATKVHDLGGGRYLGRFELPAGMPLMAADLRERMSARAAAQYPGNAGLQRGMDPVARAESLRRARQSRRDSASRAGTRRAVSQRMGERSQGVLTLTRQRYDEVAEAAGFDSISGLLAAVPVLRDVDLAVLLGVSASTAQRVRRRYGGTADADRNRRRAQQVAAGARRRYEERAQVAGYADAAALLAATRHLSDPAVAALLGVSKSSANRLRHDQRMVS